MAFEDRCSPQNASSPQGIPHTPSKSIKSDASSLSRHNYVADSSICDFSHKEEKVDSDSFKTEYCISRYDKDEFITEESKNTTNKFSFSISNILSDSFGRIIPKTKCTKKEKIFRPFEIVETEDNRQLSSNDNRIYFNNLSENENSNNSNNSNQTYENSSEKIIIKNFQFAELLQLTSKRLYDEANECNEKKSEPLYNYASYSRNIDEIAEFNKTQNLFGSITQSYVPPLGSLSKAVSQIGQNNFSNLVISSNFSNFANTTSETSSKHSSEVPINTDFNFKSQNSNQQENIDSDDCKSETSSNRDDNQKMWPAWIYCTRYSDRPSSGPRYRRPKVKTDKEEKRPRTAFSNEQLTRLKREFNENRYLTERRRQQLSSELGLNEAQIKIWFQNKRAKIKKTSGSKNPLALQLMAQGLYNHTTVPLTKEEEELELRMNGQI